MNKPPHILLLEDVPADAELAERELRRAGIEFTSLRVDTEADFRRALDEFAPDLILSDYKLPQFTGLDALHILRELKTGVPLILVTGSLTEELAVECMRAGATDYVLKSSLKRLPSAAANALEKAQAQRAHETAIAALQRSEEQYRELFENANDLIYTHDLAGNYTSLNKAGERITGYTRAEAMSMNMADMLSPEQLTRAYEMMSNKVEAGGTTLYELEITAKDGHHVCLELNTRLIYNQQGQPIGVQGIGRDITERKRAAEDLRENEERYRQLIEFSPDAVIVHSEGRFTFANSAAAKLFGASESAQLLGRPVMDFVHPDYRSLVGQRIEHVIGGQEVPLVEERLVRLDGQVIEAEVMALPFMHQGRPAVQCIVRDITERKRAERERNTERELLDALFEHLPVGVLLRDAQGRYTRANRRAAQILEIEREELIGMTAEELLQREQITRADGQPLQLEQMHSAIAIRWQQAVSARPALITTPAGNRRRVVASAAPVSLSESELGSVVVIEDVTEQHATQEQLRQSQKMESIGLLAGGVAHDFNNLLTAIQGNTQLALRKVGADDPLRHRLLEVEKAAQRAAVLTRQLLAFSRRQYLERKPANLNDTINDIMKMVRRIIGEDVEVRVNEAADLAMVFADPTQIEQVIMNLAVNARDAMPRGGLLAIETSNVELDAAYCRRYGYVQPGRYVEIKVSDTGCGMDAETQARIFEPFFTTKELGKGTGLGLAMVYGIVKQHDGHINVYSEPGHGTTFRIYLPVHARTTEVEPPLTPAPLAGGTETILVAEDEAALRALARDVLEGLGYKVLLAADGAEAVRLFATEHARIDLLLLDVVMPHMGGHEAYERMRVGNGTPPVIFMTGYSAETVQSKFVKHNRFIEEAGAVLLQKPYNVESLGHMVREVLDGRRKNNHGRSLHRPH
jgi:two-component system, cell cycle sensor histidine kinase and response regulator CckA